MVQLTSARTTPRLTLRRFQLEDLDQLSEILADEEVNRYLYSEPRDRAATLELLRRRVEKPTEVGDDNILNVAVELRAPRRLIGEFMLRWPNNEHRQGEMGGSLHRDCQGQGFASEVYDELLNLAFTEHGLRRVVGRCDARNSASVRSLKKAGLHQEAHFVENEFVKGEWTSEIVMAIRLDEWRARHEIEN